MKKHTKLSMPWFYELLDKGECDIMDFKENLEDRETYVSRLFKMMVEEGHLELIPSSSTADRRYKKGER